MTGFTLYFTLHLHKKPTYHADFYSSVPSICDNNYIFLSVSFVFGVQVETRIGSTFLKTPSRKASGRKDTRFTKALRKHKAWVYFIGGHSSRPSCSSFPLDEII